MNEEQLKTLSIRIAALVDALEDRSQSAVSGIYDSSERLDNTARQLTNNVMRLTQDVTRSVGIETSAAATQGLQQAFRPLLQEMQQVADRSSQAAATLQAQSETLRLVQRGMVWRSGMALLLGAGLAIGVAGFLLWKSHQTLREAQFSESLLRAAQSGAITECDGQLCARIPPSAPRFSKNNDFVLLP